MEYGPEFDDLRGDYSSVEERLDVVAGYADDGDDGNGRLAEYFEQELKSLRSEISARQTDPNHKPQPVPSAYELQEQDAWQAMEDEAAEGRPDPF